MPDYLCHLSDGHVVPGNRDLEVQVGLNKLVCSMAAAKTNIFSMQSFEDNARRLNNFFLSTPWRRPCNRRGLSTNGDEAFKGIFLLLRWGNKYVWSCNTCQLGDPQLRVSRKNVDSNTRWSMEARRNAWKACGDGCAQQ